MFALGDRIAGSLQSTPEYVTIPPELTLPR